MLRDWRPSWRTLIVPMPFIIGATFCIHAWYADFVVARRQQTTSGTIVAHEPANHDRYGYTFSVNGKTYSGWQSPYDNQQFTVGQVVTVHYDPEDPNNSALVDFNESSGRALGPVPLLLVAVVFVAVIEFVRRRSVSKSRPIRS